MCSVKYRGTRVIKLSTTVQRAKSPVGTCRSAARTPSAKSGNSPLPLHVPYVNELSNSYPFLNLRPCCLRLRPA